MWSSVSPCGCQARGSSATGGTRRPGRMALRIEDYALIGDTHTAALVGKDGSIDWLCFPRFDSGACFAALLGDEHNGHWRIAPAGGARTVRRRYRGDTLILETDFETGRGAVRVIDFMPPRGDAADVVRIVQGLRGRVDMRMELRIRFDYGHLTPWVRRADGALWAVGGAEGLALRTPIGVHGENRATVAELSVGEDDRVPFVLPYPLPREPLPPAIDPERALLETEDYWIGWSARCSY